MKHIPEMQTKNSPACKILKPALNIGLGTWVFGDSYYWKAQNRQDSIKTIHAALRLGIRHFDTAASYGRGSAEQLLGQQLWRFRNDIPREELHLSTKIMPCEISLFKKNIEKSLSRLQTDYLNTCFIHWPSSRISFEPLLEVLLELKNKGLIREIGISNFPASMLQEAVRYAQIDCYQGAYSLAWRYPEQQIFPLCTRYGIRFEAYSPLAQGLLSGSYTHTLHTLKTSSDKRKNLIILSETCYPFLEALLKLIGELAVEYHTTPAAISIAWLCAEKESSYSSYKTLLLGARNRTQLEANVSASHILLTQNALDKLSDCSAELAKSIPETCDNIFNHLW